MTQPKPAQQLASAVSVDTKARAPQPLTSSNLTPPLAADFSDRKATSQAFADREVSPEELVLGGSPDAARQLAHIQDRLRRLGATHYVLESWGSEQQLYRFCCKMAIAGNANFTRYFEATDASPLRTMASVLRQVEAWGNGDSLAASASGAMVGQ